MSYLHSEQLLEMYERLAKDKKAIENYVNYLLYQPKVSPFPIEAQAAMLAKIAVEKYGHEKSYIVWQCHKSVWTNLPLYDSSKGNIKHFVCMMVLNKLNKLMRDNPNAPLEESKRAEIAARSAKVTPMHDYFEEQLLKSEEPIVEEEPRSMLELYEGFK